MSSRYPTPSTSKSTKSRDRIEQNLREKRDKYAKRWGTASHLDVSQNNRLVLSLRSGQPADSDWALDRLLQVSQEDPELLRLTEFIGLLSALLAIIQTFLDSRAEAEQGGHLLGFWKDGVWEMGKARATVAALIIKNLAIDPVNLKPLVMNKKLVQLISDTLEIGVLEGYEAEETGELRLYLLEVLEVLADTITLELPTDSKLKSSSVRLFPLLAGLTRSTDRALVISSFRVLTTLSKMEASDPVFVLSDYDTSRPHPHPIETAIELLPILDFELSLVALDFIYQHTLLAANSVLFCARPELVGILRLVCSKIRLGGKVEALPMEAPHVSARPWYNPNRHQIKFGGLVTLGSTLAISEIELYELQMLEEPARTLAWMKLVFEPSEELSITQLVLWNAYKTQWFASPPCLDAGDVIKLSTEAFPDSLPTVKDGKFFVRGITIKDRTDLTPVFSCQWKPCKNRKGPNTAEALYQHTVSKHINLENPPSSCRYSECSYVATSTTPQLIINELALHIRTHMPVHLLLRNAPKTRTSQIPLDGMLPFVKAPYRHERFHAHADETAEITGLALLSILVLRNIAGTIRFALSNSSSGGKSIAALAEENSIFEELELANEGIENLNNFDQVDFGPARKGIEALLSLESMLVTRATGSHSLKILADVLEVIAVSRKEARDAGMEIDSSP